MLVCFVVKACKGKYYVLKIWGSYPIFSKLKNQTTHYEFSAKPYKCL